MLPYVSLIVITKNDIETIEECIVSLLDQTYSKENYEVIFVDGHSIDGTDELIRGYAKKFSFLKLYYENDGTMGHARNVGISKSKGNIIAFTDGDAVVPTNWFEKIVDVFTNVEPLALGGMDVMVSGDKSDHIIDSWRRLKKLRGVKAIPCIKTVNFAITRDALLSCGGFDSRLSHLDETELLARLYSKTKSNNVIYDPEIVVYHKRSPSTKGTRIGKRIRKVFEKSLIGTPVLMKKHMVRVAIENPTSPLGTSFFMIPMCVIGVPLFFFSLATGFLTKFLAFAALFYIALLGSYLGHMFLQTRKANLIIPLLLTIDFVVRFVGTFLGLMKWLVSFAKK